MHPWIHTSPLFPNLHLLHHRPPVPSPSLASSLPCRHPENFATGKLRQVPSRRTFFPTEFSRPQIPPPEEAGAIARPHKRRSAQSAGRKIYCLRQGTSKRRTLSQGFFLAGGRGGEGEGILDPKLGVPKMARQDFPSCKFRCFPLESLWSGERGRGFGGSPPPRPWFLIILKKPCPQPRPRKFVNFHVAQSSSFQAQQQPRSGTRPNVPPPDGDHQTRRTTRWVLS